MNEEKKVDNLSFLKGIIIGGVAGAIAALLYAPKAGKEFREEIKKKSNELKDEFDKQYAETKETAIKIVDDNIKRVEILKREAEEKLKQAQELAIDILDATKKKYDEMTDKVSTKKMNQVT